MAGGDIVLKELEDVEKNKIPRRIIHFVSGETMEEYSTDEEEEEEEEQQVEFYSMDTATMTWARYIQFWILRVATTAFFTCEFLGGRLAHLFGLTVPKYQYAIDEYYRAQEEDSDDEYVDDVIDTGDTNILNEKIHLQMQSVVYGTIHHPKDGLTEPGDQVQMDTETDDMDSVATGK
ncbi:protein FAM177B [Discoglossus pictus]